MKRFQSTLLMALSLCFISVVLMSNVPAPKAKPKIKGMTTEEIKNLANNVFEDPTFKLIYKKDIGNILFRMHSSIDTKKLDELSKKTNFSTDESNYVLSAVFGFRDINDYNDYTELYKCLIEKYGIGNLDNNGQVQFFSDLRNKEIEYTGELAELSKDPIKLDSLNKSYTGPGGIRPECWKCVFDYQACLQPYFERWAIQQL